MAGKDPTDPREGDPEGVEIDFDDDLEGWGDDDLDADEEEFSDHTDVTMAPDKGPQEPDPGEDLFHLQPAPVAQAADGDQQASSDPFQQLLNGVRQAGQQQDPAGPPADEPPADEPPREEFPAAEAALEGIPDAEMEPELMLEPGELDRALDALQGEQTPPDGVELFEGVSLEQPEEPAADGVGDQMLDQVLDDVPEDSAAPAEPAPEGLKSEVMPLSGDWEIEDLADTPLVPLPPETVDQAAAPADDAAVEAPPEDAPSEDAPSMDTPSEEVDEEAIVAEEQAPPLRPRREPPPIEPLPLEGDAPEGDNTWLTDFQLYKQEIQALARQGKWKQMAAVTGHALLNAPYADQLTRTGMLLDLARIYRDRLDDRERAEQTFLLVAHDEPANPEAMTFLIEHFQADNRWGAIYDLYMAAVEATWDPQERLNWTRQAAELVGRHSDDVKLAIGAWENLWRLGDAVDEASRELTKLYRAAGRWSEMATFLEQQAERLEGAAQMVVLRELAEVKLSGLQDPDGASAVLERIVERSLQDPIATLQLARVYAQREDWEGLRRLGQQAGSDEVPPEAARDLQHLVADALWQAGMLDEAVEFYDRLLELDAADAMASTRKEEYLSRTGRDDELLELLIAKADASDDDDQRAEMLGKAAELAEQKLLSPDQAAQLWERRITIDAEHRGSYEALARLYEVLGDLRGEARALEGLLGLTKEMQGRVELMRKLGEHYAVRMEDDDKAEGCWKEILSLDPSDLGVREELIELHRRRGDFDSLHSALMRQIYLTADESRAQKLARLAAENLEQNFEDPVRSVEAWRRVLDFAPQDTDALAALGQLYSALARRRDLIAVLEQEIRVKDQLEQKVDRTLQIARLWQDEEQPRAEAATYERILRWEPGNPEALDRLVGLYCEQDQQARGVALLEAASLQTEAVDLRIDLLRRILELQPDEDHAARFFLLLRILLLSDGEREVVEELKQEAEAAGQWPEMTGVLTLLASQEPDVNRRVALLQELANIWEQKLESPERAYLALQRVFLNPQNHPEVLEQVSRLAAETGRHEDLLAVLDRLTSPEFDLEQRKEVIRQRAAIFEKDLEDGKRAFDEQLRLLGLSPGDLEPLGELERLAGAHNLWRQLDHVLPTIWDRAATAEQRLDLMARAERIRREQLAEPDAAFDTLVLRYRLAPDSPEIREALLETAEEVNALDWVLPLVEAAAHVEQGPGASLELASVARLSQEKLEDRDRAFDLLTAAQVADPAAAELGPRLEDLADQDGRWESLADVLRIAAASTDDRDRTVELLQRIASIYEDKLEQPDRAIDIYSRILDIKGDDLQALDVMVDWHRGREEWRDLRDRLRQQIELIDEPEGKIPLLLEVARTSEIALEDPEEALAAYGEVLEQDPEQEEARKGLDGLVSAISEPSLRLRWLQMQLKASPEERADELYLEIARLQEDDLQSTDGAIATLQQMVQQAGADNAGFLMLSGLLRQTGRWRDLVELLRDRAGATEDHELKLASLDEAMAICTEHLGDAAGELWEDLYRAVLAIRSEDREIRVRLARHLRQAGRVEDLCQLLQENLEHLEHPEDRLASSYELARLLALNLDRADEARDIWEKILDKHPEEERAVLALASAALRREDLDQYLAYRRRQARMLAPTEAALVLCHLAEVAEENEAIGDQMVPLYREARTLDPSNMPAMEALKGIGRRLKNLRPAAALLPLEGERELTHKERAERLRALGDGSMDTDLQQAVDWYQRAVAVDPDNAEVWSSLAGALEQVPDPEGAHRARQARLQTVERSEPLNMDDLSGEAGRLYEQALSARTAGLKEAHARLIRRAHDLAPHHPSSALAVSRMMIEGGQTEQAHTLLHTILTHHLADLTEDQRIEALHGRGVTLRLLGRTKEALEDIREVLRLQPLQAEALGAMGEMLAQSGHTAAAIEIQIRALTTIEDPAERAELYYRLGVLWEDGLGALEEAGVCYELALAEGLEHRDLLHRALRHLQRTGRPDQSLEVVASLLPTAEDPDELATLWLVRGEIFATREGQEEAAVEAFDMALSYDPTCQEARDGLTVVLERQRDWSQLLQVLEATCDVGTLEQQSGALRRMARISGDELGDPDQAESYLRRSVEVSPSREALEQLEQIYSDDLGKLEQRKEVLGLLTAFGPPWFERCLELARLLLEQDQAWAWCLMSPLLGVSQVDQDIKGVIQDMRKEFERPPILCPSAEDQDLLRHPDVVPELTAALAEVGDKVKGLGICSLDGAGDGNAIPIGETTTMGKAFGAVASAMGLEGVILHRTGTLAESTCVVNCDPQPAVVVRTDVMQQLVHAEVGFLFAYVLELARPGNRLMAALPRDNRDALVPGLWLALGFSDSAGKFATRIADSIREATDEQQRGAWAEQLDAFKDQDPVELGRRWWRGACFTARRAGLLAGADLRQVFRVQSRLEEDVARPRVVARMEELDAYVADSEVLVDLVAFSASPAFGKLIRRGVTSHT